MLETVESWIGWGLGLTGVTVLLALLLNFSAAAVFGFLGLLAIAGVVIAAVK